MFRSYRLIPSPAFFCFLFGFLCVAVLFSALPVSAFAKEKIVTIGTGAVTGVYYPAGGAICRLVNRGRKDHGLRCFVESTGGSMDNISALRRGDVDLGIVQSDWQYYAYEGKGPFAEEPPLRELRSVFSLHSDMFTVAVAKDSGIARFDDLKGKRVNIGDPGSGMRSIMLELLKAKHWDPSDFSEVQGMKPDVATKAICKGKLDAMVFAAGHPNGLIQELTSQCGARLIPVEGAEVDAMVRQNPYYARTAIPGGMYAGNPKNIPTFGVKSTLVTTTAMSEEAVYQLTKAVFENFDSFKTLHFVFATLDKERMVHSGVIAPLHPGALRYFREAGLEK